MSTAQLNDRRRARSPLAIDPNTLWYASLSEMDKVGEKQAMQDAVLYKEYMQQVNSGDVFDCRPEKTGGEACLIKSAKEPTHLDLLDARLNRA